MADIRTLVQLQDTLDREMAWRVKEISAFSIVSKGASPSKKFFIRAGIALVYAHWEGFIKGASEFYLSYVHNQRHKYSELKSCFAVFGLKAKLQNLAVSRRSKPNIEIFDFIVSELDSQANMQLSSAINTESNLTSVVFENIAASLNIDVSRYETKFNLIDESLVRRRNQVAHGEFVDIGAKEFGELVDEVLQLMRDYKVDLLNAASMKEYKK